jgi:hypothetical protein
MDQVEQNEYYQALSIITVEQQRQLGPAGDSQPVIEAGHGELSVAAKGYLSQAIAVLSGSQHRTG